MPIYMHDRLGSIEHIMVNELRQQLWSKLYEKRCELEVYCRWHGLRVPKARSVELPREELINALARLERENN